MLLGVGGRVFVLLELGAGAESRVWINDRNVLFVVSCALLLVRKRVHLDDLDGCLVGTLSRDERLRYELLIRRVPISLQVSTLNGHHLGLV